VSVVVVYMYCPVDQPAVLVNLLVEEGVQKPADLIIMQCVLILVP